MKSLNEIYTGIKDKFFGLTQLDVKDGTVADSYFLASSTAVEEAYKEIENNKNPHIYTNLKGETIDSTGYMINCPRLPNESDESYLYRVMNWTLSNERVNITAIENALISMIYASNVSYVPLTQGVGTATAYIIPKSYDGDIPAKAIEETKQRLAKVVNPSSVIEYVIPDTRSVKFSMYLATDGDLENIKNNIKTKITDYVNSIVPGQYLEVGEINKIGVNEPNVEYFTTYKLYINDQEINDISVLQKIESKFLFEDIIWLTVVR